MIEAHRAFCEIGNLAESTADVDVGIADSICKPEGDFEKFNRIGRSKDIINTSENQTTSHGVDVTRILSQIAGDPTYHFFQIVGAEGKCPDRYIQQAIVWAADYGIDVLNLSVGSDHASRSDKDCDHTGPECALHEAAAYATKNGMSIVAATGNEPNADAVCCPALSNKTIAAGGCIAECTASITSETATGMRSTIRPPKACWIDRPDNAGESASFCMMNGCGSGKSCEENQEIAAWDGNVRFIYNTPDAFAPTVLPRFSSDGSVRMGSGTSFSAPIISAAVVNAIETLQHSGADPKPDEIRKAVRVTTDNIPEVPGGIINGLSLTNELLDSYGLPLVSEDDSESLYRKMP